MNYRPLDTLLEPVLAVPKVLITLILLPTRENSCSHPAAVTQAPVLTRTAENVSPLSLTELTAQITPPTKVEPVVTAQKDDQATSPSLQQVLQEAAANAFSHLDSATYLNSLFKG